MEYRRAADGQNGERIAIVTSKETTDANGAKIPGIYKRYSNGSPVTFKEGEEVKTGVIDMITNIGMTAKIGDAPNVPVDINTIQAGGRKSRRKSRKNKSRRYRRV
jgi:hypothetical protein